MTDLNDLVRLGAAYMRGPRPDVDEAYCGWCGCRADDHDYSTGPIRCTGCAGGICDRTTEES